MRSAAPVVAAAAASALVYGYSYGISSNHAFWLPAVLERLTPGLYAGDPAVAAALRAPTLFWDLWAPLARVWGPEAAALAVWGACLLGVCAASWSAARALGGGRRVAALASGLAMLSPALRLSAPWAGDPLLKGFLDQTVAAWPWALWAVVHWLGGRRVRAGLLLAPAVLLNPLVGGLSALWLAASAAIMKEGRAAAAVLAPAASAVLALWLAGRLGRADSAVLFAATPNTYAASAWPWERWLHASAWAALWAGAVLRHPRRAELSPLLISGMALGGLGVLAGAAPALAPLAAFQLLRLDAPLVWLGLVAAAGSAAVLLERGGSGAAAGAAGLWPLVHAFPGPVLVSWSAALLAARTPAVRRALGMAGAAAGAAALFLPPGHPAGTAPSAALAAMASGAAVALSGGGWAPALLWLAWSLTPALPAVLAGRTLQSRELPTLAEAWARSTPSGTRFAVDPASSGFRLRSRRPVCAEWSDFNLALYDRAATSAWRERMAGLGVDWSKVPAERAAALLGWDRAALNRQPSPATKGLGSWPPASLRGCAARYLVAPEGSLAWPAVFSGGGETVYEVPTGPG